MLNLETKLSIPPHPGIKITRKTKLIFFLFFSQNFLSKSRMVIKYLEKIYKFGPNSLEIFKLLPFILSSTETEKLISVIQAFNGPLWIPENKDYVFISIFLALILVIFGGTCAKLNKSSSCVKYIQPKNQIIIANVVGILQCSEFKVLFNFNQKFE